MRPSVPAWTRMLLALAMASLFTGCGAMALPGLAASAEPVRPQRPEIAFTEASRLLDDATIEQLQVQAREVILDAVRNTGRVAGEGEGPDDTSCFFEDDTLHYTYRYNPLSDADPLANADGDVDGTGGDENGDADGDADSDETQALATRRVQIEIPKARVLWVKPNTLGNWRWGLVIEADGEEHEYTLNNLGQIARVIDAFEILGAEIVY